MPIINFILSVLGIIGATPFFSLAQPISVGDKIPNIIAGHVINSENRQLNLSDYKGKLIILDYWGTGCTSCIAAFPKMDSLQNQFRDKIQIIAVNSESEDSTLRFFKKHKRIKLPGIPFVTQDTLMSKLFPHLSVPHHVWIDSSNYVRFISGGHNTTKEHLALYFQNKLQLKLKKDITDSDNEKLFIAEGNGQWADKEAIYYSTLIHATGIQSFLKSSNHIRRCGSVLALLKIAYTPNSDLTGYNFDSPYTVDLQVKDRSKYIFPADPNKLDAWAENYYYWYELVVPVTKSKELYKIMLADLKRYFDLDVVVKKRKIKCLALVRIDPSKPIKSNEDSLMNTNPMEYTPTIKLAGKKLENLLTGEMNANRTNNFPPVIDQTGGGMDKVNIKLSFEALENPPTLSKLRKELQKCNLDLVERFCLTDVLVVKEKNQIE